MVTAAVVAMAAGTQPHWLGSARLGSTQLGSARMCSGARRWLVEAGIKNNTAVGLAERGTDENGVRSRDEKGEPGLGGG